MFERRELILKIACGLVAALLLYRLVLAVAHINPLYHVTIPALPALASSTNSSPSKAAATNAITKGPKGSTNTLAQANAGNKNTNTEVGTNLISRSTNSGQTTQARLVVATNNAGRGTNAFVLSTNTSVGSITNLAQSSNSIRGATNSATNAPRPSQLAVAQLPPGMPPGAVPGMPQGRFPGMPPGGMPGMGPGGMPGMPPPAAPLPPEIQARIDKVIESEILAPVMHPMPTALIGIAGKDVFLRTSNGQTGLIKEGEELGGVKVLRVAVNRVLVEEQGQRKELTIFSGLGSESLLSTQNDSPK